MLTTMHIFAMVLVSVAMALSLAHALELPGKRRLSKEAYFSVQPIYYPGFTLGGFVGEVGGMVALLAVLFVVPVGTSRFWWILTSFVLLTAAHLTYWLVTHPVNNFWVRDVEMSRFGSRFFSLFKGASSGDWTRLRDIWEYSHVARAVFATLSMIAAAIGLAQ